MRFIFCFILTWGVVVGCASRFKHETGAETVQAQTETQTPSSPREASSDGIESKLATVGVYFSERRHQEGLQIGSEVVADPRLQWESLYRLVQMYLSEELFQPAVKALEQRSEITNQSSPLLLLLCYGYYQFQFYDEALLACDRSELKARETQLSQTSSSFYTQLLVMQAKAAIQVGNFPKSKEIIESVLAKSPSHCDGRYVLGLLHYRLQEFQGSADQLAYMDDSCQQRFPRTILLHVLSLIKAQQVDVAMQRIDEFLAKSSLSEEVRGDLKRLKEEFKK